MEFHHGSIYGPSGYFFFFGGGGGFKRIGSGFWTFLLFEALRAAIPLMDEMGVSEIGNPNLVHEIVGSLL